MLNTRVVPTLADNRKARFDYNILEKLEAGIVLSGQETKSAKLGNIDLSGSYAIVRGGELWLIGATIPPYQPKNAPEDYDPERTRKLLVTKPELKKLYGKSEEKGLTVIPLRVYTKNGFVKIALGVGQSRKKKDKREYLKKRAVERDIEREV